MNYEILVFMWYVVGFFVCNNEGDVERVEDIIKYVIND